MDDRYQWYPGHMTKAMRMMREQIALVDMVIEIADARIPRSSRNPDIDELTAGKPRLIILNKADLADEEKSLEWVKALRRDQAEAILMNAKDNADKGRVLNSVRKLMQERIKKLEAKGVRPEIRAMIAGIPNVGKSTFINRMAGKNLAKTGNKPGVTKGKQWIALGEGLRALDTPGVLWPKFEDPETGRDLAIIGSLNDVNIDLATLACELLKIIGKNYPQAAASFYGYDLSKAPEIMEERGYLIPEAGELELIAKARGCIMKGARFDLDKAAQILLTDYRAGRLGRLTLEDIHTSEGQINHE